MIVYLKGLVQIKEKDGVVVVANNVGFEVFAPASTRESVKVGEEVEFFTHEYLRENARELYGFASRGELQLFHDLLKVSGVGPKMALNVLSLGYARVCEAITKGDVGLLSSISGVGKKTAQKIVLELKGVLTDIKELASVDEDVVQALQRLGYTQREARDAMQFVEDVEGTEEKIKSALKVLGKR